MNVLAVGANPDDVEFLCSGTLARYAKRGDAVSICFITNGDKGSTTIPPKEMAAIRQKEAEASARILGAALYPLGLSDGEAVPSVALRERIEKVIRETNADIILTHAPTDYMSDHTCASQLVVDASFWAGASPKSDPSGKVPYGKQPTVYFMDTVCGLRFQPEEYVDITDVMDIKIEMLSQHKSQVDFMKKRDGFDFLDFMITAARYRGYQCGVRYAEGFIQHRRYPTVPTKRQLP
jgi:N-acetylglucosamine malate deacetylase 1